MLEEFATMLAISFVVLCLATAGFSAVYRGWNDTVDEVILRPILVPTWTILALCHKMSSVLLIAIGTIFLGFGEFVHNMANLFVRLGERLQRFGEYLRYSAY